MVQTTAVDEKIETLRIYEKKIVDLTRRNRLLKYPVKARVVTFDLSPAEFQERFGHIDDLTIEFPHKSILNENGTAEDQEDAYLPPTDPKGEKLISTLQALRLDTKRKFEEHGLHTLFLTIGRVRWKQPLAGKGSSDAIDEYDYDAPLLLIPLEIKELKQPRKKTVIHTYLEVSDIVVNPVMLLLLELEYGVHPPKQHDIAEGVDLPSLLTTLEKKLEVSFADARINCEISEEIRIGQYSFHGQQIYEDLRNNENSIVGHEFVGALCGKGQLSQAGLSFDESDPDELLKVEEDFSVMDADVSQLRVIQKALQGTNLIVQGPPGTGKSQTIVNLISNLLARGKKVLVVCEKHVALEVVLKRLRDVGLERLCLPLFRHETDRKRFAKSVIEDRDVLIQQFGRQDTGVDSVLSLRVQSIEKLRGYASVLATVVEPLKKSVHWVHGELARAQALNTDTSLAWEGGDPSEVTIESYRRTLTLLDNIAPVLNKIADPQFLIWRGVQKSSFSPDFASRVYAVLATIESELANFIRQQPEYITIQSIADLRASIGAIKQLAETPTAFSGLIFREEVAFEAMGEFLEQAVTLGNEYHGLAASLDKKYNVPAKWRGVELEKSVIRDTALISDIRVAISHAKIVKRSLDAATSSAEVLKNPDLLDLSVEDLLHYRNILLIDPLIKKLVGWSNIVSLQSALISLTTLHTIYCKLEAANVVFEKWAILLNELDVKETEAVIKEFDKGYHQFLHLFSPQYREVKKIVASWCNVNAPKRYRDFKQVAQAVKDRHNLEERLGVLLAQFNDKYMEKRRRLEQHAIPILYKNAKNLAEWMRIDGKKELPSRLRQTIEKNEDTRAMKEFSDALSDLEKVMRGSWRIFTATSDLARTSIADIIAGFKEMCRSAEAIQALEVSARSLICKGKSPESLEELKRDVEIINRLKDSFDRIRSLPITSFLSDTEAVWILDNFEKFSAIVLKVSDIRNNLSGLPPSQEKISVRTAFQMVAEAKTKTLGWDAVVRKYEDAVANLSKLFENDHSVEKMEILEVREYRQKILSMIADQEGLEAWMEYRKYAHQIRDTGHAWFIDAIEGRSVAHPAALFAQSLWNAWLEIYYRDNPALRDFSLREHSHIVAEFRKQERQVLATNARRVLYRVAPGLQKAKQRGGEAEKFIIRQSQLTRAQKPVRQVVMKCTSHIQEYKPCWMMSPLTLSSYIPYGSLDFDVVIFDEASQMRVEHAIGTIARGKQVIIFGDEHQLPPTSFFDTAPDAEDEEAEEQDFESILHAAKTILPGADDSLLYHYRSRYEDLITFSNREVYQDRLITFPNPNQNVRGVAFEYIADGVFDGGRKREGHAGTRRNIIEARSVVEVCARYAAEYPEKSMGVIAFSKSQEVAIRDALMDFLKDHPELTLKLDENQEGSGAFFIKNLESVQGDEREIIVLSVGYGRDMNGNIFNRFGPINGRNGYRRLNVAITRAQEKIICVSSMKSTDMNPGEISRGAKMLQKYLEYAEHGVKTLEAGRLVTDFEDQEADSPFELEVQRALKSVGYQVRRQVGASGFKIDLAIVNPKTGGDYILGIECDGASYHSSYSARLNDRLRQAILERLGWKIYRVWSQHWITHKQEIIDDIISAVNGNQ